MNYVELDRKVEVLVRALEDAKREVEPTIREGLTTGEALHDVLRTIGEASSHSWIGWHSRMYYGDLAGSPPPTQSWDADWGGIHGIPEGWNQWSASEIQQETEHRSGASLAELATQATEVRERCQPLQREALAILLPVSDLAGLETEKALVAEKLTDVAWITSLDSIIRPLTPSAVVTRDQHALSQGVHVPSHVRVTAGVISHTSTLANCRDFLDDAIQVCRQIRMKLAAEASEGKGSAAPPSTREADRALARRAELLGIALFLVLALLVGATAAYLVFEVVTHRVVDAALIVCSALLLAGLYAALVNRAHAIRILVVAAGAGGALAAVSQLLGEFE